MGLKKILRWKRRRGLSAAVLLDLNDQMNNPRSTLQISEIAADARAQAMPIAPVLNQISRQPGLLDHQHVPPRDGREH
jgi:hypothetical protein